ncbi:MAG: hypothetical protein ACE5KM_17025 [Planctomycetaceae bacterium]
MKKLALLAGLFVIAVLADVLFSPAAVQVKKGKTRIAETEQLMEGIVFPNCAGLGKALKGKGPADDKAWKKAASKAACLNEASYILMQDGRCPDGVWAKAAKTTLRKGSADVLAALEKKDLTAARAAFKVTTSACASCHKKHRK